jgi:phosphate/sulfate permease
MEQFYLILVVILFALAISDLIVGVSNDAVNFLNSAIGSKAAPKWVIYSMAAVGVLIGATFSTGMMEVARKGVFYPDMFSFSEIMVLFLAVMITDVVLLDAFNTLGLPTSTTVSLVFELLGSAFAVSLVKISALDGTIGDLAQYINTGKALAIISGILVSIIIAFTFGTLMQYVSRLIFTFRFEKKLRKLGSLFGGISITLISYFILIKGIDGSSFASVPVGSQGVPLAEWVGTHTGTILLVSLIGWTFITQLLWWFLKINILKVVVLVGTFALAMAFAGNDLVNFIGVPIAGYSSFQAWQAAGAADPAGFTMEMLLGDVKTPFIFLLISGLVMVITLITSKKAKKVTETEVNLGRQLEGAERFGSSGIARAIVRSSVRLNKRINKFMPTGVNQFVKKRFAPVEVSDDPEAPAFDLLRAAVNLVVASSLIAFGTSLKLPLSTTYVTFMVAMGSSLADRAWGRESAVYRVSGVFTVVGGWFLTAVIAFTISGLVAWLISVGGWIAITALILLAVGLVLRTHILFRRRLGQTAEDEELINEVDELVKRIEKAGNQAVKTIVNTNRVFSESLDSFIREDISGIREAMALNLQLNEKTKKQKNKCISVLSKMKMVDVDAGYFYIQLVDAQREMAHAIHFLVDPLKLHMENQHKPFTDSQNTQIRSLIREVDDFFTFALEIVREQKFDNIDLLVTRRMVLSESLYSIEKDQVKRIKEREVNTRNSLLFFKSLTETRNLLLHTVTMVKAFRNFYQSSGKYL